MPLIYEAYFVMDKDGLEKQFPAAHPNKFYHHLTIAFRPKALSMPDKIGAQEHLKAIGRLTTDKIDALLIGTHSDKPFPHITLSTADGVNPAESKTELSEHFDKIVYFVEPKSIRTAYGYYDGKEVITKPKVEAEFMERAA